MKLFPLKSSDGMPNSMQNGNTGAREFPPARGETHTPVAVRQKGAEAPWSVLVE